MRLLVLDCDSTLSAIEGVDELARLRSEDCFLQSVALTEAAMNGEVSVEEVFARRLELIQPSRQMVEQVAKSYLEQMAPGLEQALRQVRAQGWTPIILSGGFTEAIDPLAAALGVEQVEAVSLQFAAAGEYAGYDEAYPTTRSGGKPEVIERLKTQLRAEQVVMVGDGVSDLETLPLVDAFVACFAFVRRAALVNAVEEGKASALEEFAELPDLIKQSLG